MRDEAISPRRRWLAAQPTAGTLAAPARTSRLAERLRSLPAALGPERRGALRDVAAVFLWTRVPVWLIAAIAARTAGAATSGNRFRLDIPGLTHPFGGPLAALLTPLARWDAVWYLGIAHHGYLAVGVGAARSTAFFPLYPLLVRTLAGWSSAPSALIVSSFAASLGTFAAALYLLHRLVTLELGRSAARSTLLLLAAFPAAFYFSAPYSESLFLLVSVGAFYAARTGRFAVAGCLTALASATRSEGVVLVAPLAILYLYGPRTNGAPAPLASATSAAQRLLPRYRPRRDIAFLALAPVGLAAYSLHLALSVGDGLAYMHLEREWYRSFAGPLGGVVDGTRAAFDGLLQLLSGQRAHHYFAPAGGDPFVAAAHDLTLFAFLVFALVAAVGVLRRLPLAYGAYTAAALALPLSFPTATQPLMSLPRFLTVVFPLFMWLALALRTPRRRFIWLAGSGLALGIMTVQFASWHWVA